MKSVNETLIEFLKGNPNATKTQIAEAIELKGLPLFNLLKKMQTDGIINSVGAGNETTYSLAEVQSKETAASGRVTNDEVVTTEVVADVKDEKQTEATIQPTEPSKVSIRNNDKFKFNGEELGKGQLVRSVIVQYVADNEGTTLKKLKEVFPDELLKRFGLFQEVEKAREISGKKYDRYFFKEEHIIKLKDKKIVVCNQWTAENIKPFLKVAKDLGYKIK